MTRSVILFSFLLLVFMSCTKTILLKDVELYNSFRSVKTFYNGGDRTDYINNKVVVLENDTNTYLLNPKFVALRSGIEINKVFKKNSNDSTSQSIFFEQLLLNAQKINLHSLRTNSDSSKLLLINSYDILLLKNTCAEKNYDLLNYMDAKIFKKLNDSIFYIKRDYDIR